MKSQTFIPLLLGVVMLLISSLARGNDKYTETMTKNIETVYAAKTIDEYQSSANTFERIGAAEKTKWEPYYYASFAYVMMCNNEKDGTKKDAYLDLAEADMKKAKEIAPSESEVIAMEGFIYMMRVTVDPATRGQQYAGLAMMTFNKATTLNPENPRALALLAQMQYGTAQFFGSPTTEACATMSKAGEKFETYKSENVLAPKWGRGMTEGFKEKCK